MYHRRCMTTKQCKQNEQKKEEQNANCFLTHNKIGYAILTVTNHNAHCLCQPSFVQFGSFRNAITFKMQYNHHRHQLSRNNRVCSMISSFWIRVSVWLEPGKCNCSPDDVGTIQSQEWIKYLVQVEYIYIVGLVSTAYHSNNVQYAKGVAIGRHQCSATLSRVGVSVQMLFEIYWRRCFQTHIHSWFVMISTKPNTLQLPASSWHWIDSLNWKLEASYHSML